MAETRTFVIIGAGLAGAKAAETLREQGFTGQIVLVGEERDRPYERPPLSKGYLLGRDPRDQAYVHPGDWYPERNVELLLGYRATALDPAAHTVTLSAASNAISTAASVLRYDRLLLATGSRVRTLSVPGGDLPEVCYLRTFEQSEAIRDRLSEGGRVVIVGGGWIGLETAAAAREYGADVTVVEGDTLPLRRVLGDEVGKVFADLHRTHGVRFRFGSGVTGFSGVDKLTGVVLADNTVLPADLAIVGVGIRPATELAEAAGLTIDNGVATDATLRTSDPDIFACGDVASWESGLLGRRVRVEHWANALAAGPAAAKAMLDSDAGYDPVPYFFSDQYDLGMEYAGYVEPGGYDQVLFRGDPTIRPDASPEFVAFWLSGGRVLAGMNVNVWDVTDTIQAMVRAGYAGKAVDTDRLADPDVPLGDLVS